IFYDVPGGLQTAYAREKSGCGQVTKQFVVLVFPSFFTPNNDTFNDVWEVTGMENYPQAEVTIFDRYGKLIAKLSRLKMSWDGTLNQIPLPASDYWYALKVDDSIPVLRGHFTLKR
ncbi:MAG TPA: T9SS type B sorting domain-containing protein, partial [Flavobacterium sp.]|nr:T9SS type B sorting domain-containing protein [Flavobacterium sp.]